jgi:hypothetical protein
MAQAPEFIVKVEGEPTPRPIAFEDIFEIKDKLQSLTLLWDTNCYHVNRSRRYVCVNGGRKIGLKYFKGCRDLGIFYRRRNSVEITFNTIPNTAMQGERMIRYLLGFEGTVDGQERLVFLNISEDGRHWIWQDHK